MRKEQFKCTRVHLEDKYCVEVCEFNNGEVKVYLFSELPWAPKLCVFSYMNDNDIVDDGKLESIVNRAKKCIKAYEELFNVIDVPYNIV